MEQQQLRPYGGRWSNGDWLILGSLNVVAVLLPALVSFEAGSFSIAQLDDWCYRRIAEHFAHSGHLVFINCPTTTLIGQILWSWPFLKAFGNHGWVFGISTALLAVIGISCAYFVARQILTRLWASAAVLLLVAIPGFAMNTSTFMTDVPALAAEMACLALGIAALGRRDRRRWLLLGGAMAVGLFAFSIREFAIAAPVAVLLCAGADDTPQSRSRYLAAGVVELVMCAVVYVWSTHIPGAIHGIYLPGRSPIDLVVEAYFTMAFMLSPAIAVAAWRWFRWHISWGSTTAVVVCGGGLVFDRLHGLFVGNLLNQQGMAGSAILVGGRPTLLPDPLWDLMTTVALASGGLLAGITITVGRKALPRWRSWAWATPRGTIAVFAALLAVGLTVFAFSTFFDRYLWPLVFAMGILLFSDGRRQMRSAWPRHVVRIVVALGGLLLIVTAVLTVNADVYSAARWRAGQLAVSRGVRATAVDAGYEWVGAHARGDRPQSPSSVPAYESWYARLEPGFHECAIVSASPLSYPDLHLTKATNYRLLGFIGRRTALYVYLSSAAGC